MRIIDEICKEKMRLGMFKHQKNRLENLLQLEIKKQGPKTRISVFEKMERYISTSEINILSNIAGLTNEIACYQEKIRVTQIHFDKLLDLVKSHLDIEEGSIMFDIFNLHMIEGHSLKRVSIDKCWSYGYVRNSSQKVKSVNVNINLTKNASIFFTTF